MLAVHTLQSTDTSDRVNGTMSIDSIQAFFADPPPTYLNAELAVCFVLSVLLQQDMYATALSQRLEQSYPAYRVSDTILYRSLTRLEDDGVIRSYWQKGSGQGRPRRMFTLIPSHRKQAAALVKLWDAYMQQHLYPLGLNYYGSRLGARTR